MTAFDADVMAADGRVDFHKLAGVLDLSTSELNLILEVNHSSIDADPTANGPQEVAVKLLTMMNALASFTQERRFALYWLRTPQKELAGATALAWMQEGHLDDIIHFVGALSNFQPD